jgi:hypothetical protein
MIILHPKPFFLFYPFFLGKFLPFSRWLFFWDALDSWEEERRFRQFEVVSRGLEIVDLLLFGEGLHGGGGLVFVGDCSLVDECDI